MTPSEYEALRPFATIRQQEHIDALVKYGSQRKAAAGIGVSARKFAESLARLQKKAALQGHSPAHDMTHAAPDGFKVKGVSTYYDEDGKVRGQWVKTTQDQERQLAIMQDAIAAFADELPRAVLVKSAKAGNADLLNCYVITDFHLGALSWHPETGADWDTDIAEATLVEWFRQAIEQSPKASAAVFAQLSDLLHWDGFDAVTPASKNLLDADGRFPRLARIAIRVIRQIIAMLLSRHDTVHVIMADANHDPVSQVWLREWLSVFYENEPRITVDTSPSPYNAYEFGKVALFMHHGHKRKIDNVAEVFAAQFREMFGRTKYAYAHTGHLHNQQMRENNMMIVEQHRTLAAPDAYAARGGWLSGRDAKVITYHRDYGEVGRVTVSYDMVRNGLDLH